MSAVPTAVSHASSPSRTTAATMLGRRLSRCWRRTSRSSSAASASGAGTDGDPQRPWDDLDRALDVGVADVEMQGGAEHAGPEIAEEHAVVAQTRECGRLVETERLDRDPDEVRLDRGKIDGNARFGEPLGEAPGPPVVLGEPGQMAVEGVERRRRHDSRLAHRAAEQELALPRPLDQLRRAGEDGAE